MKVLIAFDKFKDSLSATQACALALQALCRAPGHWTTDQAPLTDGGEGFAEILTRAARGRLETATVVGPRGEPVQAQFGLAPLSHVPAAARRLLDLPDDFPAGDDPQIAVVEMAAASGLALLPETGRDPWQTTSFGTGQLLRSAADAGACAIVLGVGGSATNDLGLGALSALGIRFSSGAGEPFSTPAPAVWKRIDRIEGGVRPPLPPVRVACDVANPLLGPGGCTTVYGPQKGLQPLDVQKMEDAVASMAARLCRHFGKETAFLQLPGNGAAGGIPFGLACATPTRLMPGFEFVSAWLDLEARIAAADLVITGEGTFDASSLQGKGPGAIALRAVQLGKRVYLFAGKVSAGPVPGLALRAITPAGMPPGEALAAAPRLLDETVYEVFASTWPVGNVDTRAGRGATIEGSRGF